MEFTAVTAKKNKGQCHYNALKFIKILAIGTP